MTDRRANFAAVGVPLGRQEVEGGGRRNEPTMSFRINDIAFQMVLYSRFEVVAAVIEGRVDAVRPY